MYRDLSLANFFTLTDPFLNFCTSFGYFLWWVVAVIESWWLKLPIFWVAWMMSMSMKLGPSEGTETDNCRQKNI